MGAVEPNPWLSIFRSWYYSWFFLTVEECFQNLLSCSYKASLFFLKNELWTDRIILWAFNLFLLLHLSIKMPNFMEMFLKNKLWVIRIILWAADLFHYASIVCKELRVNRIIFWATKMFHYVTFVYKEV